MAYAPHLAVQLPLFGLDRVLDRRGFYETTFRDTRNRLVSVRATPPRERDILAAQYDAHALWTMHVLPRSGGLRPDGSGRVALGASAEIARLVGWRIDGGTPARIQRALTYLSRVRCELASVYCDGMEPISVRVREFCPITWTAEQMSWVAPGERVNAGDLFTAYIAHELLMLGPADILGRVDHWETSAFSWDAARFAELVAVKFPKHHVPQTVTVRLAEYCKQHPLPFEGAARSVERLRAALADLMRFGAVTRLEPLPETEALEPRVRVHLGVSRERIWRPSDRDRAQPSTESGWREPLERLSSTLQFFAERRERGGAVRSPTHYICAALREAWTSVGTRPLLRREARGARP